MTPLEIMAKAYSNETLFWSVRVAKRGDISRLYRGSDVIAEFVTAEEASLALCERRHLASIRAALLALAEAELPESALKCRLGLNPINGQEMFESRMDLRPMIFQAMLRAIAEDHPSRMIFLDAPCHEAEDRNRWK